MSDRQTQRRRGNHRVADPSKSSRLGLLESSSIDYYVYRSLTLEQSEYQVKAFFAMAQTRPNTKKLRMGPSNLYSSPRKWLNILRRANPGLMSFDLNLLGCVSQRLSAEIFLSLPQLRPYAQMVESGESDGLSLILTAPSPTEDSSSEVDSGREFVIWVDDTGTPSIGFGAEHTHENIEADGIAAIIDRAKAILEDKLLIIEDIGGEYPGHSSWIDLRDPHALAEELTSPYSSGRASLKSWSGNADRQIGLDDLLY
jgi:hypothetical protein